MKAPTASLSPSSALKPSGDELFYRYDLKVKTAEAMALISSMMYSFSWFLGFCALTWATTVVLGGLLSLLTSHDYFSVVGLLMLEAVRTAFFNDLGTWMAIHGSPDSKLLFYSTTASETRLALARIFSQALQLSITAISIVVPVRRIKEVCNLPPPDPSSPDIFDYQKTSLIIFYSLVLTNGTTAAVAVMFNKVVLPYFVTSYSLRKYHDSLVWRRMVDGLLWDNDGFELLTWAFKVQADVYRSSITTRPWFVKQLYGDLLQYLYYHPKHKGFEMAVVALESDDPYQRQAGANIVGLWVDLSEEVEKTGEVKGVLTRLLLQKQLLAKLVEMLGHVGSGRASAASLAKLAVKDGETLLTVQSEDNDLKIADILMNRIHETVVMGKPNNSISYIKALIPILSHIRAIQEIDQDVDMTTVEDGLGFYSPSKLSTLKDDLWIIVSKYTDGLKRLQGMAACAYRIVSPKEPCDELLQGLVMTTPRGNVRQYMLADEQEYFLSLLGTSNLPSAWVGPTRVRPVMEDHDTLEALPWLARQSTFLMATLLTITIIIIIIACIILFWYSHF